MDVIEILDYSPEWAVTFRKLEAVYRTHLDGLIDNVEHVGSTSVPGLAAKPVIDIDIVIRDRRHSPDIIARLHELGYEHRGNLGISDREAFGRVSDAVPYSDLGSNWAAHHLYLCPAESISLRNHLTLRNALREDVDLVKRYADLKRQLAKEFPYDMNGYVAGKTAFITRILERKGFDKQELLRIAEENAV